MLQVESRENGGSSHGLSSIAVPTGCKAAYQSILVPRCMQPWWRSGILNPESLHPLRTVPVPMYDFLSMSSRFHGSCATIYLPWDYYYYYHDTLSNRLVTWSNVERMCAYTAIVESHRIVALYRYHYRISETENHWKTPRGVAGSRSIARAGILAFCRAGKHSRSSRPSQVHGRLFFSCPSLDLHDSCLTDLRPILLLFWCLVGSLRIQVRGLHVRYDIDALWRYEYRTPLLILTTHTRTRTRTRSHPSSPRRAAIRTRLIRQHHRRGPREGCLPPQWNQIRWTKIHPPQDERSLLFLTKHHPPRLVYIKELQMQTQTRRRRRRRRPLILLRFPHVHYQLPQ